MNGQFQLPKRIPRLPRTAGAALFALLAILSSPGGSDGHEIPNSVTVQAYVRPEGDVLRMLVRVPLSSMRDFNFPVRGPGFLQIAESEPYLLDAAQIWIVEYLQFFENDERLRNPVITSVRISLPSDQSFVSYEQARAHIQSPPLPETTDLPQAQAMLDAVIEYPIQSDQSEFAINSELAHLGISTLTILRFELPGEPERVFQFRGNSGLVDLDPRWYQAAFRFVALGFDHILEGIDHLLFIFCLVLPFRSIRPLLTLVTSFTVAHSITLAASAFGYAPSSLWFPPLVEMLIALSIVFMAFENIVGANLQRRWIVAFAFGLVHGFGFSFLLRESLQFAGSHLIASLLAFNVGVEFGQIAVLLALVPALVLLFKYVLDERVGIILLSALVAHTAWHWMMERWEVVQAYAIQFPPFDLALLLLAIRWLIAILILAAFLWMMHGIFTKIRWLDPEPTPRAKAES